MKRTLLAVLLVGSLFLPICPQLLPKNGVVYAGHNGNRRKASLDLKNKVDRGRGDDRVAVGASDRDQPSANHRIKRDGGAGR